MDITPIPIPTQEDRISSINRYFETVVDGQKTTWLEHNAIYCIVSDTAITSPTLGTSGTYVFDVMQEYGGFTVAAGKVKVPKKGVYYLGSMLNWYQNNVPTITMTLYPPGLISSSSLTSSNDNYGYSTLGSGVIIPLNKDDEVYVNYDVSSASAYSPNQCYTVGDYTQNRLFIFEMPTLSIN